MARSKDIAFAAGLVLATTAATMNVHQNESNVQPKPIRPMVTTVNVGRVSVSAIARHNTVPALSTTQERTKFIYTYLIHHGLSRIAAAGSMGDFWVEDPQFEANRPGGDLGQWQGDRFAGYIGNRPVGLKYFAQSKHKSVSTLPVELGYYFEELHNGRYAAEDDRRVLKMLNAASSPTVAADIDMIYYERPNPALANAGARESKATTIFYQFNPNH